MSKPTITLTPLAAWLLLAVAIATLFPISTALLQFIWIISLAVFALSILSPRQWILLGIVAGVPILALLLPIPLPDWPILVRLVIVLAVWLTVLTVATALATLVFLASIFYFITVIGPEPNSRYRLSFLPFILYRAGVGLDKLEFRMLKST